MSEARDLAERASSMIAGGVIPPDEVIAVALTAIALAMTEPPRETFLGVDPSLPRIKPSVIYDGLGGTDDGDD